MRENKSVQAVTVNLDLTGGDAAQSYLKSAQITLPSLIAAKEDIDELQPYGLRYVPFNVLLDKDGNVVAAHPGPVSLQEMTNWMNKYQ